MRFILIAFVQVEFYHPLVIDNLLRIKSVDSHALEWHLKRFPLVGFFVFDPIHVFQHLPGKSSDQNGVIILKMASSAQDENGNHNLLGDSGLWTCTLVNNDD